eukprot:12978382-Ditylum_brightwellii.AAC.1
MMHTRDCVQTDSTVLFNGVDNSAECANKHLTHLSQVADCCRTSRNEHNKHLVCNKNYDVDNGADNGDNDSVGNGDNDCVDDGAEGADKHLEHLSQAADCCRTNRNKQNKHLVCNENKDVEYGVDNSVGN